MAVRIGNMEFISPSFNFDFMRYRKLWIWISVVLTLISVLIIAIRGLNYSVDYLGGSEVNVSLAAGSVTRDKLAEIAERAGVGRVEVTSFGAESDRKYTVRIQRSAGQDEQSVGKQNEVLIDKLKQEIGADKIKVDSVTNISGKIGKEEELKGYLALLISFVGILIYVSYRFDSRFAPGAVICLAHDVIVALGVMTLLGRPFSISSIAAFLTIVGYSINDTVIVYDRIRENQELHPKMSMVDVVNLSINRTLNRTILTSLTALMALIVLVLFGGGAIEDFALTMFIGILVGTYSSVYVAAPLTIVMDDFLTKKGWKQAGNVTKAKVVVDPNFAPPVMIPKPTKVTEGS